MHLVTFCSARKSQHFFSSLYSTMTNPTSVEKLCEIVSSTYGGLDELESSLNQCSIPLTSSLVLETITSCKNTAHSRKLLRFFLWSSKNLGPSLEDKDYNQAIRVFSRKKDHTAINILASDLRKEGRSMEAGTFGLISESLVNLGREDEALGIFKNLEKNYKLPQDKFTVRAIVHALCSKGHAKRAEGVVYHHRDKIIGVESCIYRSLLYGWSMQKDVKEARRIIKEMKSLGITPDLFCFNTFLRCLCERNLIKNPSGLVPEALNVMMEMRSYKVVPNSVSYNILLSCLGKTRRVKESCQVFETMKNTGCSPDWVSYYLVTKVLFLSGRFGKGNKIVDEMIEQGVGPDRKFYYDLVGILCGVEREKYALELLERMKRSGLGGYGPVYDVLIEKFCRGGDFEKGRELFEEAMEMGVELRCERDVLDATVTRVFKPVRDLEEKISVVDCSHVVDEKSSKQVIKASVVGCPKGKNSKKQVTSKKRGKKGKRSKKKK